MAEQGSVHAYWSSRRAFVLAAAGAAVGLGNIWKFPYMLGDNGGSAFVLVYLLCVATLGLPMMIAEIALGRIGRQNPVNTLSSIAADVGASPLWAWVGWLGAATLLAVLAFYSVVAGWSLGYVVRALAGVFQGMDHAQVNQVWLDFLANPWELMLWHAVFMVLTLFVVAQGVQQGLERASRLMMPLLLLMLVVLALYALLTGDPKSTWSFMFGLRFEDLSWSVAVAAMGHACFTLAVGAGAMLVYGAYLPEQVPVSSSVLIIAVLDVAVALLAGLAIYPLVFQFHLPVAEGPGLMFRILPIAFAQIPLGRLIGVLFFTLIWFAAWTSSISMAEPLVSLLMERFGLRRTRAAALTGCLAWGLGLLSLLSFNVWSDVQLAGRWDLFTLATDIPTNVLLPLGGILFSVFAGWVVPERLMGPVVGLPHWCLYRLWLFLVRWVVPVAIFAIILKPIISPA